MINDRRFFVRIFPPQCISDKNKHVFDQQNNTYYDLCVKFLAVTSDKSPCRVDINLNLQFLVTAKQDQDHITTILVIYQGIEKN